MKCFPFFIFFLIATQSYSQKGLNYHKTEEFILKFKKDSAVHYLNKLENAADKEFLKKMILEDNLSYKDYYSFLSNLTKRENVDFILATNYFNKQLKEPDYKKGLQKDYFNIKWGLITQLRDKALLQMASLEQSKLEKYVANFTTKDKNFLWANTKMQTHPIVMYLIENKIKEGKDLTLKCLDVARKLNDIELEITFLYYSLSFLVNEGKLDEYITTCNTILELEKQLPKQSSFYYSTITDLLNAYIYKGGYDEKVLQLMDELYNSYSRIYSYALYAQLIATTEKESELKNKILSKFEVNNVLELVKKFKILGKDLNLNDYFDLINRAAIALAAHNYYKEALDYKQEAIDVTRKIYSQELSESIANYKTEQAVKIKEQEIFIEKEKNKLYLIIASLCFVLFLIAFFVMRKLTKQSAELSQKNNLINNSLEEKELLIKEMHHRVKNNFQIITSLLDLQTDEIQDEKVLEILEKGRNRIKSMSLIHQKLFQSKSGFIKFNDFIDLLVKELAFLYKFNNNLEITTDVKEVYFDIDTAIPLALMINEILTNSFKYAFANTRENVLFISLQKADKENYKLIIKDNGAGIGEDFNIKEAKSTGLKLVERLVKQLHGSLVLINESGLKFEIYFKDTATRKEIS